MIENNYFRIARIAIAYDIPFRQVMSDADKLANAGFDDDAVIEELCKHYQSTEEQIKDE